MVAAVSLRSGAQRAGVRQWEMPDAIGWKKACHSGLVESKVSRGDFLADRASASGKSRRWVSAASVLPGAAGLIRTEELPAGWGLLEVWGREKGQGRRRICAPRSVPERDESSAGELRRVEIRIEPESITDFLKWKNRMAEYNRGACPKDWLPRKRKPTDFCWERRATEMRGCCDASAP